MVSPAVALAWILGAAAMPLQPGWYKLEGCKFVEGPHSDGDSVEAIHEGKRHIFRLYFVDSIESNPRSEPRRAAQAQYFGVRDDPTALKFAREAEEFTRSALQRPFTVYTRWTPVTPGSDNPSIRAFVALPDGRDLGTALVERGLAIIRSGPALSGHPTGKTKSQILKKLREAETLARVGGTGAWAGAKGESAPVARTGGPVDVSRREELRSLAGQHAVVRGMVSRVGRLPDGSLTFVNFAGTGRGDFVAIIREGSLGRIGEGFPLGIAEELPGKFVEVSGFLTLYRGNPQIEIEEASQFVILDQ